MAKFISLPLISGLDPKGFQDAQRQLQAMGGNIKAFAKNVIGAFGGVSATVGSVNFLRNAIEQSRDLERQTAALKSVFGTAADEMLRFSQGGVQMGLSTTEAARASTFLGSVLKSAGFDMQDTIGYTKELVGLASDLAATYGYDVQEALTGMTALFRGEYDPIEKFGVAMKQAEVNTLMHARRLDGLTGVEKLHAQQLIRLELLMQRTTDAQGAFSRQGGSLFVQQAKLASLWKDMQATIGDQLTPALAKFLEKLQPLVKDFAPNLEKIFASFGTLIDNIAPKLPEFADKFATAFQNAGNVLNALLPVFESLLTVVLDNINEFITMTLVFKGLKFAVGITVGAVKSYELAVKAATVASKELTLAEMATGWGAVAIAVGLTAAALVQIGIEMVNNQSKLERLKSTAVTGWTAGQSRFAADAAQPTDFAKSIAGIGKGMSNSVDQFLAQDAKNAAKIKSATGGGGAGGGAGGGGTKNAIKTFFTDLTEEVKKQALRIKLINLGLTEELINAVLGSSTWEAAANKIIAGGTKTADYVQRQFNKTKAGIDAIAQAAKDAAADAAKAAQELADAATKLAEDTARAAADAADEATRKLEEYNNALKAAGNLTKEIAGILADPALYTGVADVLGAFEQGVVSTFASIRDKVSSAL